LNHPGARIDSDSDLTYLNFFFLVSLVSWLPSCTCSCSLITTLIRNVAAAAHSHTRPHPTFHIPPHPLLRSSPSPARPLNIESHESHIIAGRAFLAWVADSTEVSFDLYQCLHEPLFLRSFGGKTLMFFRHHESSHHFPHKKLRSPLANASSQFLTFKLS
jgi:hypothetical protein